MAEQKKQYDIDSYEVVTNAIMALINDFPLLDSKEKFTFEGIDKSGFGMFPSDGAIVTQQVVDITDHVTQTCSYPFYLAYKIGAVTEKQRIITKEFMDSIGKWLEKQAISDGTTTYKIESYPTLSGDRRFKAFSRQTPAFLGATGTDFAESWVISINATYINEFDR